MVNVLCCGGGDGGTSCSFVALLRAVLFSLPGCDASVYESELVMLVVILVIHDGVDGGIVVVGGGDAAEWCPWCSSSVHRNRVLKRVLENYGKDA